ncbi:fungal zn binuclear cluster domain containing protein [Phlyctema vagabunda]|uniref:Fungal zn binuclear cluster domain containing protein n=1 Tax=Phlyctema vagabunda TaxID=108571 RepID=A0ABR4PMH3_9HELO
MYTVRLQKKKCNEQRPQCDRCTERSLQCEYEPVKPRKRRRSSVFEKTLSHDGGSPKYYNESWSSHYENLSPIDGEGVTHVDAWDDASLYQYQASDISVADWDLGIEAGDDVEEILRSETDQIPSGTLIRSRSQYPDLAMIAPSPIASPLVEFSAPLFMEFTDKTNRRSLVDHFCNVLSHLIVFKEDTGNPFRQLVLPLSHASSPVMNAIFALSSAHLEYRGVENQERSLDFHNKALQGLAQLIDQNKHSNREEILGAIMLLVYYEVLVQRGNSNIVNGHLKGAMTIMKTHPQVDSTPTSIFLERAFRFYDVIAALSLGTSPNTSSQPSPSPFPLAITTDDSARNPLSAVDTLLGLSTDLWPIIHRLSHLLSFKTSLESAIACGELSKATVLRTELESTSQAIENALTNWKPAIVTRSDEDEKTLEKDPIEEARILSILANAEAYRQSAFVYLYRTINSHPSSHPLVQKHTHLSLVACSNVVVHAGPMSALLWPLFVAACEATSEEDRDLAKQAFTGTERRQGMNNISRAWEVVGEVWKGADDGMEVDWRRVCEDKGLCIVFG